ncbi:MAG: hypothetical protein UX08_C0001G0061 [Candidatus Collierbacteria bacterium GW2011_GWB1_45_35]|uniref:Uncharacterized protein n=1 Tax=Candidatus Collierbacteria bacterium GW2011_GWB2_45_17 TaxID=1618388 RepID=A0A837IF25_9BACT|nr:MAG: hypothetical protein UW48_C0003G0058 [Microgenomates group bacterium GW2011_GWC1_44_23]KKT95923.1 MAG: hypothetical protein UW96_C0003G0058 [Candidatus Collierbacteria bacterium GW2011_GWA1_45_15]KKU00973.1 MAG: hypothetical protein UX01_C0003G0026 [Candidatus Collierbacteria bacterium GW2011_GWB2_45_17]KKU05934.1 MAG: hypothetical protein UX08_C0001G0061 [Candidatus Collierbacteria bacterium GW2011_GWB1_45_35]KKU08587.1 MAG: hypothetical protein UX11_C0002G0027 [Candidatus Collierbacte
MLTTADKNWIKTNFATKDDLSNYATRAELFKEIGEFRLEMKESLNEIKNTLDYVVGEIKENRQERDVISHRVYRDHTPRLEDHEKRIVKIESYPRIISSTV